MGRESCGEEDCSNSLDWQKQFGSICQKAFLFAADSIGFSEEDVALLGAFDEGTSLQVRTDGGLSAFIFLSRGFCQRDGFSPDAANLMPVGFIRMLKSSDNFYEFAEMDRDNSETRSLLRTTPQ